MPRPPLVVPPPPGLSLVHSLYIPSYPDLAQCALYQLRCLLGRTAYMPPLPLASESAPAPHWPPPAFRTFTLIPFSSLRPAVIAWRRRRRRRRSGGGGGGTTGMFFAVTTGMLTAAPSGRMILLNYFREQKSGMFSLLQRGGHTAPGLLVRAGTDTRCRRARRHAVPIYALPFTVSRGRRPGAFFLRGRMARRAEG
jgi:hypothetical protein